MAECEKHIVIFRAAKGPEDLYEKILSQAGFAVHFVKTLRFDFVNPDELAIALSTQHGGLVVTSQTAVESLTHALSKCDDSDDILRRWHDVPVFVVGKATATAVHKLGLKSTGEICGNADRLADAIKIFYSSHDKSDVLPLLYPRGNLSRDTLPSALVEAKLRVSSIVCYNTTSDPDIGQQLQHLSQKGVLSKKSWVVFFSPSGVQFVLPLLQVHCKNEDLKVAAIGPTTAAALKDAGLSPTVAHKPTPEALVDIIQ